MKWRTVPVDLTNDMLLGAMLVSPVLEESDKAMERLLRRLYAAMIDAAPGSPAGSAQPARWLVDIPGTDGVVMRDHLAAMRLAEGTDGATVRPLYDAPPGLADSPCSAPPGYRLQPICEYDASNVVREADDAQIAELAAEVARLRAQLAAAERRIERLEGLLTYAAHKAPEKDGFEINTADALDAMTPAAQAAFWDRYHWLRRKDQAGEGGGNG